MEAPALSVSGEASRFTCPSMRRRDRAPIALQPANSSVTPPGGLKGKTSRCCYGGLAINVAELIGADETNTDHRHAGMRCGCGMPW
jgi:hypothetical protein